MHHKNCDYICSDVPAECNCIFLLIEDEMMLERADEALDEDFLGEDPCPQLLPFPD